MRIHHIINKKIVLCIELGTYLSTYLFLIFILSFRSIYLATLVQKGCSSLEKSNKTFSRVSRVLLRDHRQNKSHAFVHLTTREIIVAAPVHN